MLKVCIYSVMLMIGSLVPSLSSASDLENLRSCNINTQCVVRVMKLDNGQMIKIEDIKRLRYEMAQSGFRLVNENVMQCRPSRHASSNVCAQRNSCYNVRVNLSSQPPICTRDAGVCPRLTNQQLNQMSAAAKRAGWVFIPTNVQVCV